MGVHSGWRKALDHSTSPFSYGVEAFSLPTRDRGYVVGDHGMIYRYRIVPIDYKAKELSRRLCCHPARRPENGEGEGDPSRFPDGRSLLYGG